MLPVSSKTMQIRIRKLEIIHTSRGLTRGMAEGGWRSESYVIDSPEILTLLSLQSCCCCYCMPGMRWHLKIFIKFRV